MQCQTRKQVHLAGCGSGLLLACLAAWALPAGAAMRGGCADCHTMHNSQDGAPMVRGGGAASPMLTRGSCVGCHAMNPAGGQKIVTIGSSQFPQVMHNDPSGDLAAGNFAYISGDKTAPFGASGKNGHNVVDLVSAESVQTFPPGFRHATQGIGEGGFDLQKFTCAGYMGCHGLRGQPLSVPAEFGGEGSTIYRTGLLAFQGYEGATRFSGAHHGNYDGRKLGGDHPDFASDPLTHSYRFLHRLQGYGNENQRWQNASSGSHNEYYGRISTAAYSSGNNCTLCHGEYGQNALNSRVQTPMMTMTGFCITCHTDFHTSAEAGASAFLRHPSDYVIKNAGEYAAYTVYDITAPVGRQLVPDAPSGTVSPGSDVVMCLSCHMAHASPYPSMLRFDYSAMMAHEGGEAADTGCFVCHTSKDE
jgi:hypothetical protein